MTDKKKYPAALGLHVAKEICDVLKPLCHRLVIAGSLRRRKKFIGDVEILYITKTENRKDRGDMFETETVFLVDEQIQKWIKAGVLELRPNVNGGTTFGVKNKLMIHCATGMPLDFFCETDEANWSRSLVIRTGPKELNLKLIASAAERGIAVHAYGNALTEILNGSVIPCASEKAFFEICGVAYLEPWER